jgi:hypothetical protein
VVDADHELIIVKCIRAAVKMRLPEVGTGIFSRIPRLTGLIMSAGILLSENGWRVAGLMIWRENCPLRSAAVGMTMRHFVRCPTLQRGLVTDEEEFLVAAAVQPRISTGPPSVAPT